jgi:alkylation response protein AidB-like acyl-CoA dehydrogenase
MKTTALARGGDFIINGTKHFISHADHADYVILFAASGEEDSPRGKRKLITAFLVDKGTPGFEVRPGYRNVSHRGYNNCILEFNDCRIPKGAVLGRWITASRSPIPGSERRACRSRPAVSGAPNALEAAKGVGGAAGPVWSADR